MGKNIEFDILARDRASKTFDHVGRASDGLGSKLGTLGKIGVLAVGGAAVGGIVALGAAMVNGVKDAASYQELANKTAAVLKSTGNAARQSVKGIQQRAGALESLSGVDEEIIINGQNVLATFTKVRDGVGKGNDIFNQATTAALNMSTALGTDMQGSVIQLGKALNDPIKGVTALSRVGVSFTAQQKKQIRTLVDSGKTLDAQKIILKELNTEFGGSAAAAGKGFNGAWARAKDSVQDAFRAIGTKLLPVLTKVADYVAEHAGPFIEGFTRKLQQIWTKVSPALKALASWFMDSGIPAIKKLAGWVQNTLIPAIKSLAGWIQNTVIPAIKKFVGWIRDDLWPALKKGYDTIMPALKQALQIVGDAFKGGGDKGKSFGDFIKGAGKIIVDYVIPILSSLIRTWLPMVATGWRIVIEAIKVVIRIGQTLAAAWNAVITGILRGFANVASGLAMLLRGLSHIPGFGWAADAARKLDSAAAKARALADAINRIPAKKTVTVNTYFKTHGSPNPLGTSGGGNGVKGAATGMRNWGGGMLLVGEEGPELLSLPKGSDVYTNTETKQMLSRKRSGGSMGGGDTYVFNISGIVGNEHAVVDKIHKLLLAKQRQSGVGLGFQSA